MGNRPNLLGRIVLGAMGLPTTQQIGRFNQVLLNYIGNSVLWQPDGYNANIGAYSSNAVLYSIVNRIAQKASIAPFKVYKVKDKKKHLQMKHWTGDSATGDSIKRAMSLKMLTYEEDDNHPLNKLIERPNKWQRGNEFTVNCVGFKLLTGNRFIFLNKLDAGADSGKPYEMYNLPPQEMSITGDGSPYGVKHYTFLLAKDDPIAPEDLIHSKYFNPDFSVDGSHLWGLSPVKAGARNLTRSNSAIERSVMQLQNAGAAGVMFRKDMGSDDTDSLETNEMVRRKVNERINGMDKTGTISVANGDLGYINFGLSAVEMEIINSEKWSATQLCNIFGIPPGLFDPDKATYANEKEFKKGLITGGVIPELSSLRDDWNEVAKLYKEDIYVDYDLSVYPELMEDFDKLATTLKEAWWFTGNQKRLRMGDDEDKDEPMMDKYILPAGMVPIDQLGDNTGDLLGAMGANN